MPKNKLMKWNCTTTIHSYSHEVSKEAFEEWNEKVGKQLDSPILFHYLDSRTFKFHFFLPEKIGFDELGTRVNMFAFFMMVAFNLASPGSHLWWPPALWPVKYEIEENRTKTGVFLPFRPFLDRQYANYPLDRKMIDNTFLIWGTLIHLEELFFKHYVKAMNLLSSPSPEVDFYEEIFLNFWKVIERFVAVEIKKNRKAEVKDVKVILEAFRQVGVNKEMEEEIKKLYIVRGNTIAHSYGKEQPITFEEVGKCKVFADYLLHKHLINRTREKLKSRNS